MIARIPLPPLMAHERYTAWRGSANANALLREQWRVVEKQRARLACNEAPTARIARVSP